VQNLQLEINLWRLNKGNAHLCRCRRRISATQNTTGWRHSNFLIQITEKQRTLEKHGRTVTKLDRQTRIVPSK
jgi:hypothetical protein